MVTVSFKHRPPWFLDKSLSGYVFIYESKVSEFEISRFYSVVISENFQATSEVWILNQFLSMFSTQRKIYCYLHYAKPYLRPTSSQKNVSKFRIDEQRKEVELCTFNDVICTYLFTFVYDHHPFICHFAPPYKVGEGVACLSVCASSFVDLSAFVSLTFHLHW